MYVLPEKFLTRMKERLGSAYPAFLASYERPPYRALRVNTLKISAEEFLRLAPEEFRLGGRFLEDGTGFYTEGEKLGADPWHFAGLFYLQEPSAMEAGELAAECKGKRILDLCAAPGGKATHIAQKTEGEGILIANEPDYKRARVLMENIERMGIVNSAVISASPEVLAGNFPAYFDLILADAPCSGEGMFKKEPNAVREWSEENVKMCAARQKRILGCAAEMLRAGGKLVYSTCTFSEEEDEWQTEDFLSLHPGFSLSVQRKLYPHTFGGEGHFMAVLEKSPDGFGLPAGGESARIRKAFPVHGNGAAEKAFRRFSEDFFEDGMTFEGNIHTSADGRMYLVPCGMPAFGDATLLRPGVELGEWDGKIFRPAHALVMAFGSRAKRKLSLSRERAKAYLHGETLPCGFDNGWVAVTVDGFPLGLGKAVGGTLKNHYPKNLRLRTYNAGL